ncbi:MAG: GNAT family N-acetyltransferase [Cyanobacteria bacterium P01_F01_bin.143]
MIRLATPDDQQALMAIAEAINLFTPPELEALEEMLAESFEGDSDSFWITYDDGEPRGVAYGAPEVYADGVSNLYFIAVHPDYQGQGIGGEMLRYVEKMLTERGDRLLLVETSGLPDFEKTRTFYRKNGYEEEARIRDYYKAGDDKIIFRKVLTED